MNYEIMIIAYDVDDIKGEIVKFVDVWATHTNAHAEDIIKAVEHIYNDEHPSRDIAEIRVTIKD